MNSDIVGLINRHGPFAVGLSGEDAGTVHREPQDGGRGRRAGGHRPGRRHRRRRPGRDPGAAGRRPDPGRLQRGRAAGDGEVYNVNADTAAAALAVALGAAKLVVLTDVEGLYADWPSSADVISELTAAELERLLPGLSAGMMPKMEACLTRGARRRPAGARPGRPGAARPAAGDLHRLRHRHDGAVLEVASDAARTSLQSGSRRRSCPTTACPPLALGRGQGCRVWDADGREYLDLIAGIAVSSLGHAHPAIVEAVSRQVAEARAHLQPVPARAARCGWPSGCSACWAPPAAVFFANSRHRGQRGRAQAGRGASPDPARPVIVAAERSFHGRTIGALALTGKESIRAPFGPFGRTVRFVPYGDAGALRAAVGPDAAAVFLEPGLGESGVVPAPDGLPAAARAGVRRGRRAARAGRDPDRHRPDRALVRAPGRRGRARTC